MKKDTRKLIDALSSGPVRQYLTDHEHSDLHKIILQNKEILGVPTTQLFEQIAVRKRAKDKLPLYYNTPKVIYPAQENFEQSSSQTTALFKSEIATRLVNQQPSTGADLTGGFGVDTYFISRSMSKFHCIEPNASLIEIARFNHELLGATNIKYHNIKAENFLESTTETLDFVYIDPSRRKIGGKKVVGFEDSQPDIIRLAPTIYGKAQRLLVKASPLMDLQAGMSQIPFVKTVYVVSVNNECKEVLFLGERAYKGFPTVNAVNLLPAGPSQIFSFTFEEERAQLIAFSEPLEYLYEPNSSILKAGAFKSIGARYNLKKIHANTHLYTSSELVEAFPGRKFRIEAIVRPNPVEIKSYVPDSRANVTTRNYPLTADQLKKRTGVNDGGDKFLIGFTGMSKKFVVVASRL